MKKVTVFETVHPNAAGIDVGAEQIFVSPDGTEVTSFDTFTSGYHQCIEYLQQKEITEVAMEATGVYWIALYSMLESCGIRVCLVNPRETKQVKGRKTDVKDCQWIQKLFSAGILRQSFIPPGKVQGSEVAGTGKNRHHRDGQHLCEQDAEEPGVDEYQAEDSHQPDTRCQRHQDDKSYYRRQP